ncbi:MAG: DUF3179 domain-containing protein [Chloroflexi bacterium]|nr:DUF3179 domain-containing protein [Chloroflexota bacterium]
MQPSTRPHRVVRGGREGGIGRFGRALHRRGLALVVGLSLLLALACSQQTDTRAPAASPASSPSTAAEGQSSTRATETLKPTSTGQEPVRALRTPTGPPPTVDTSIAGVPVEDVLFDTFRGGFVRLSEASEETIEALRDRIKPIYEPKYDSAGDGDWLSQGDGVLGYVSSGGNAFAYPVKILNFHEIVNDVIDGVPLLVSYCPLCASGVVYHRELDGQVLLFGNTSALYQSDLVMYDHETGSYWHQVIGEAIVGPLTGSRLKPLPSMTTTWGQWKELYPDTKVLSRNLGLLQSSGNPYSRDPFLGIADQINKGRFAFPVSKEKLDDRLGPGDLVLAVQVGESHKAYLLSGAQDHVANDEVGGERLAVLVRSEGPSGFAYLSSVEGRPLTFGLEGGALRDFETGSLWDDSGRSVSGEMEGAQLTLVPSRTSFWFSIVGALPGLEVYSP